AFHQRSATAIWGGASRSGRNSPAPETVEHGSRIHEQVGIAGDGSPRSRSSFGDAMGTASSPSGEAARNRRAVGVGGGGNGGDAWPRGPTQQCSPAGGLSRSLGESCP